LAAYPESHLNVDDPTFADLYRQTRELALERLTQTGELSAPEIIGQLRKLIVESATSKGNNDQPTICDKGVSAGELIALTAACPRLRLAPSAVALSKEVAREQFGMECQSRAAASLRSKLQAMTASETADMCERARLRVQAGESQFLELTN
jgi:hypothetical protein